MLSQGRYSGTRPWTARHLLRAESRIACAWIARLPDAISAWAPLPGRPSKRGIAGSTLVDRLRDHDRKRWDRRRMGDFKPGTEETPDASAYPAQVSHFSAERRHSRNHD